MAYNLGPEEGQPDLRVTSKARNLNEWAKESNFDQVELVPTDNLKWYEGDHIISLGFNGEFVFYSDDGVLHSSPSLDAAKTAVKNFSQKAKAHKKRKIHLDVVGFGRTGVYGIHDGSAITGGTITGLHSGNGSFTGLKKDQTGSSFTPLPDTPASRSLLQELLFLKKKTSLVEDKVRKLTVTNPNGRWGGGKIDPEEYEEKIQAVEKQYNTAVKRSDELLFELRSELQELSASVIEPPTP